MFFLLGTVLGGTMELHGTNISLACFHGNSFKSKSWALFSLKDPCISFATEAQQVASEEGKTLLCLIFYFWNDTRSILITIVVSASESSEYLNSPRYKTIK